MLKWGMKPTTLATEESFFFSPFTLFNHLYLELVGERKHKKDIQAKI